MSSERVIAYRRRVIDTVACPHCFAQIGNPCHKPTGIAAISQSRYFVDYVHDDRSAEYELARDQILDVVGYDGWLDDLRIIVNGGALDQAALDAAVARLRDTFARSVM